MPYVVKMPKLGLEMERGTLLEWRVEEGAPVEEGEVLAEVESEKSIGEVDAREDGVLRLTDLQEGEAVSPGTPIGIVAGADADIADLEAQFGTVGEESRESTETDAGADETAKAISESAGGEADVDGDASRTESADVKASPKAKRRAEELGIDLTDVDGSGPQSAITADDVEAASNTETETETANKQVRASPRAKRRANTLGIDLTTVNGSGPREAITVEDVEDAAEVTSDKSTPEDGASAATGTERATATSERYRTATLVTDGNEVNSLLKTVEMAADAFDFGVSTIDVSLVAVSAALDEHPEFNATFANDTHHFHEHRDIALAVDVEGEPVESVLSTVDERTFADLVEARRDQTEQEADSGSSGKRATFALASGGVSDVRSVVTPPTVAGLVADCSKQRAIPAENGVTFRRYLRLSLAYDSRAVGNRDAEAFLETLLGRIEEAPELVLQTYR